MLKGIITNGKRKLMKLPFIAKKVDERLISTKLYFPPSEKEKIVQQGEIVKLPTTEGLVLPRVGLVKDVSVFPNLLCIRDYWPKYEKFLRQNKIPYDFYDIHAADWLEQAKNFDIIVWHTHSKPSEQYEAESKIYILEKVLNKTCLPSFDDVWAYEDKVRMSMLLKAHNLPGIRTFISFNKTESLDFLERSPLPIVSKITSGSASKGVELIKNRRQGKKLISKVFGLGADTYWSYIK